MGKGKKALDKFKLNYEEVGTRLRFPTIPKRKYIKKKGKKK